MRPSNQCEDVFAAGALGGGGEAQQQGRLQVGQPALVAGGGGVVELIDDHHGEGVRSQGRRIDPRERLHRGEHMAPLAGALAIHQQLTEGAIAQHLAEGGEVLVLLIDVEVDLQFACRRGQDCS
jgi:hypothetical protein